MAFLLLAALSCTVALILQLIWRKWWLSIVTPAILFVLFIVGGEYLLPYSGGGASMLPIAVIFVAPVALFGALFGTAIGLFIRRERAESKKP